MLILFLLWFIIIVVLAAGSASVERAALVTIFLGSVCWYLYRLEHGAEGYMSTDVVDSTKYGDPYASDNAKFTPPPEEKKWLGADFSVGNLGRISGSTGCVGGVDVYLDPKFDYDADNCLDEIDDEGQVVAQNFFAPAERGRREREGYADADSANAQMAYDRRWMFQPKTPRPDAIYDRTMGELAHLSETAEWWQAI